MNKSQTIRVALVTIGGFVVGTALYWRRRYQKVCDYLQVSREWEHRYFAAAAKDTGQVSDASTEESTASSTLTIAAKKAGTTPTDLPDRIEELQQQLDEQTTATRSAQKNWSRWWVNRHVNSSAHVDRDETAVDIVVANLDRGTMTDAKWLGKRLLDESNQIGLISAGGDQAFVIVVSSDLTDEVSALELAEGIAKQVDGGAGGDESYASGGGSDSDNILNELQHIADTLRDDLVDSPT